MSKKNVPSSKKSQQQKRITGKRGSGGEVNQTVVEGQDVLTTNQGVPISENQNSLKANSKGPVQVCRRYF